MPLRGRCRCAAPRLEGVPRPGRAVDAGVAGLPTRDHFASPPRRPMRDQCRRRGAPSNDPTRTARHRHLAPLQNPLQRVEGHAGGEQVSCRRSRAAAHRSDALAHVDAGEKTPRPTRLAPLRCARSTACAMAFRNFAHPRAMICSGGDDSPISAPRARAPVSDTISGISRTTPGGSSRQIRLVREDPRVNRANVGQFRGVVASVG